jgi:predicted ATP-dependent protease
LPGFAPDAVALLVEEGSRWAADQERLSADLRALRRLIVEAGQVAQAESAQTTLRSHVVSAIAARERRMSLVSDRLDDLIDQRVIMVDTTGAVIGQVNGLTVMSSAGYAFGKPARITARTAPGRAGIVNLERETAMSGPAHSKGILILTGYLAGRFATGYPLSLTGSICFEQIYGEIEGDSASSAELYALLSSLSGVPINQSLAVTGSVNQRGEIQPVGAVTEKVEGFYHVCARRGLTGEQGVIIPQANVRNLMLREEVVEAIRAKRFHVFVVETVDQGMELLTGTPAGCEDAHGAFAEGTVNELVGRTLRRYAELMRGF